MDKNSIQYLNRYINVTDDIEKRINKHAERYGINPEICAWYADWEDFCSDWCKDHGYTRTEARQLLHGDLGEFMILPNDLGIVRFVI